MRERSKGPSEPSGGRCKDGVPWGGVGWGELLTISRTLTGQGQEEQSLCLSAWRLTETDGLLRDVKELMAQGGPNVLGCLFQELAQDALRVPTKHL